MKIDVLSQKRRAERDQRLPVMRIAGSNTPNVQQKMLEESHKGRPAIAQMRSLGRSYV